MSGVGHKCAARNCKNRRFNSPNLSFYRFPKDEKRCRKWLLQCRREDLLQFSPDKLHNGYRLCSAHFIPEMKVLNLAPDAVPTLFSEEEGCSPRQPMKDDLDEPTEPEKDKMVKFKTSTERVRAFRKRQRALLENFKKLYNSQDAVPIVFPENKGVPRNETVMEETTELKIEEEPIDVKYSTFKDGWNETGSVGETPELKIEEPVDVKLSVFAEDWNKIVPETTELRKQLLKPLLPNRDDKSVKLKTSTERVRAYRKRKCESSVRAHVKSTQAKKNILELKLLEDAPKLFPKEEESLYCPSKKDKGDNLVVVKNSTERVRAYRKRKRDLEERSKNN